MRIGNTPIPDLPSISGIPEQGTEILLKAGDSLTVKVLFSGNGTANLKTEDGAVIKANIDGNVRLPAGSEVTLVVREVADGVVYMALSNSEETRQSPGQLPHAGQDALSLAIAQELGRMKLPLTSETIASAREMLLQSPGMSVSEAAFLAANNIPPTASALEAVKSVISGEAKIDLMLRALAESVITDESIKPDPFVSYAARGEGQGGAGGSPSAVTVSWTDFLKAVMDGVAGSEAHAAPRDIGNPETRPPAFTPQEILEPNGTPVRADAGEIAQHPDLQFVSAHPDAGAGVSTQWDASRTPGVRDNGLPVQDRPAPPGAGPERMDGVPEFSPSGKIAAPSPETVRTLFSMLTQMPAFENVSERTLTGLTETLLGVAGEYTALKEAGDDIVPRMRQLIEGLFANLGQERDGASELRRVAEELYIRLALFHELLSAATGGKSPALEQTERLLNHVRLLNDIEQLAYLQFPIYLNGEQRSADLYIYRQKRGSKRIDPENIKILLALDLEFIGHLEALISIRGKDVFLEIDVVNEDVEGFLKQNTVPLHNLLKEAGFHLTGTNVRTSAKEKEDATVVNALLTLFAHEKRTTAGFDFMV